MCCFSKPVEYVSTTQIFARPVGKGRQIVVYSMKLKAKDELAMILPLPVPAETAETAVRFINLEGYAEFFEDLHMGFPEPRPRGEPLKSEAKGGGLGAAPLAVVQVGSFEASFVPKLADFSRLDERFCLSASVWDKLPQYKTSGFAVFKLKSGEHKIHPMAFEFPCEKEETLFFPTVHIHDGEVHAKADFDHTLYCQIERDETPRTLLQWTESPGHAKDFMKVKEAKEIVLGDRHVYRKVLRGMLANKDTLV